MTYPRGVLKTIFIGCCALLITYSYRAESAYSAELVSDSKPQTAQDTESKASSPSTSNQNTSKETAKPSQIRSKRSNSLLNDEHFSDDSAGLNSAFLYSDQIMQNLLKTQSPRPLNYARSKFFLNFLKPRTTRFNAWDDHSLMHFGKRSVSSDGNGVTLRMKRSTDEWSPNTLLHFGKKAEPEISKESRDPTRTILTLEFPNFGTELEQGISSSNENKNSPVNNDQDQKEGKYIQTEDVEKKSNDPWHNMMSFGKKAESGWDQNILHFGKREEPWHSMMAFGKKSENPWDQNMLHFGKREEPWHNMMSFGKKSNTPWDQNMLHFGKREEPWHNMMSFGKKSDNSWDQNMLHFGKREEPWHNMMSFGKKSDSAWDQNMLHFGKREEPWHNMMSFGKKSDNHWDSNMLHFGKKDEPWHSMMSFGKKSDNQWDQNMLHFGKREEPWHNMMSFGKKSDSPWDQNMLHFGKREEPWHSMMSFGKKSDNPWDQNMLHFGKREEPWHNMMSFGKKSEISGINETGVEHKRDEPWHNMMSFGKKSDDFGDHLTLHFGKREEPWHNMMSFGKKSENPWDSNTLHFGKRDEPWHNMMSFGKKSENPWDSNTLHFGKREEPWHNMMSFGKRLNGMVYDQEDFGSQSDPWKDYNGMVFYKRSNPWDHNTLHFGKKSNTTLNDYLSFLKPLDKDNLKHIEKRSADAWDNHNTMHFGKKSDLEDEEDVLNGNKKSDWDTYSTLHFGKREPWTDHNTMHFGKREPWADHNTVHFGKREPFSDHNTMHFGKRELWTDHNTLHFGKRDPFESHNTMHFGKREPFESHNTMHFGKRDPFESHNTMHFGKRYPFESHNTMHFGKREPFESHNTMHFGKREPWADHNTMHFGKKSESNKVQHGTENPLHKDMNSKSLESDHKAAKIATSKENGETPKKISNLNDKISVNKRSIHDISSKTESKGIVTNDHKPQLGEKDIIQNTNLKEHIETVDQNQNQNIKSKNEVMKNKETMKGSGIQEFKVLTVKGKSLLNDNRLKDHENTIIGRSLKSIPPISINEEQQIMKPSDVSESSGYVQNVQNEGAIPNNLKHSKSQIQKRSAESDFRANAKERSKHANLYIDSFDDYSDDEIPDTVLHFGKRSLDDIDNSRVNIPDSWEVEAKRFDTLWDNHNTLHFGKKSVPWESHSTLHFGKRPNPWDNHHTMHFGKREPWNHNTMHFGKRTPFDHNTMHFGKREVSDYDASVPDKILNDLYYRRLNSLLGERNIQDLVNRIRNKFPLNDPNIKENSDFMESMKDLEKSLIYELRDKNIPFSEKLFLLENFLEHILREQRNGEIPSSNDLLSFEDYYDDDPMGNARYNSRDESVDSGNFYGRPKLDIDNFSAKSLPVAIDGVNVGKGPPSTRLVPYLKDYKSKRSYFGKPEIKRYFVPFQGPKSIVYPHAWFASQIRRSMIPRSTDFSRSFDLRMAEKKEDPFNSYMHFGRR